MDSRAADPAAIEELHKPDVAATMMQDPSMLTRLWSDDGVNLRFPGPSVVGIKAMKGAAVSHSELKPDDVNVWERRTERTSDPRALRYASPVEACPNPERSDRV